MDMIKALETYIMEKFDIRPSQAHQITDKIEKLISEEVQKINAERQVNR